MSCAPCHRLAGGRGAGDRPGDGTARRATGSAAVRRRRLRPEGDQGGVPRRGRGRGRAHAAGGVPIQRRRLAEGRGGRPRRGRSSARSALHAARPTPPARPRRLDAARPAAAAASPAAAAATSGSGAGSGSAAAAATTSAASAAATTAAAADRGGGAGSGRELVPAREAGGPRPCRRGARMHYCAHTLHRHESACCVHAAQTLRMHCTRGAAVPLRRRSCRCHISPRRSAGRPPNAHPTPSRCVCWSNASQRVG